MNQSVTLDLDHQERDILLRGLRFVRSSIRLHVEDPTAETVEQRRGAIAEIEELIARLEGSPRQTAASV